jgi:hypothetical protein
MAPVSGMASLRVGQASGRQGLAAVPRLDRRVAPGLPIGGAADDRQHAGARLLECGLLSSACAGAIVADDRLGAVRADYWWVGDGPDIGAFWLGFNRLGCPHRCLRWTRRSAYRMRCSQRAGIGASNCNPAKAPPAPRPRRWQRRRIPQQTRLARRLRSGDRRWPRAAGLSRDSRPCTQSRPRPP